MRLIVDSLIALMLLGILVAVVVYHRQNERRLSDHALVHGALASLHEQMVYRSAMGEVEVNEAGHATTIDPDWFEQQVPRNLLVPPEQPWLDVAPADEFSHHPPDPVIYQTPEGPRQAGFWYNPNLGVFRARVNRQLSEKATLRLYNRVNGTTLAALPEAFEAKRDSEVAVIVHHFSETSSDGETVEPGDSGEEAAVASSEPPPQQPKRRRTLLIESN